VPPLKSNRFQDTLLQHYAFFNFAKRYVVKNKVTPSFEVDDPIMQEFRKFLDEEKIPYTEAELIENNDWVRYNIKSEIFTDQFGQDKGLEVRAENDPLVLKALDLMGQAKQLAEHARQVVAEKSTAHALPR